MLKKELVIGRLYKARPKRHISNNELIKYYKYFILKKIYSGEAPDSYCFIIVNAVHKNGNVVQLTIYSNSIMPYFNKDDYQIF